MFAKGYTPQYSLFTMLEKLKPGIDKEKSLGALITDLFSGI